MALAKQGICSPANTNPSYCRVSSQDSSYLVVNDKASVLIPTSPPLPEIKEGVMASLFSKCHHLLYHGQTANCQVDVWVNYQPRDPTGDLITSVVSAFQDCIYRKKPSARDAVHLVQYKVDAGFCQPPNVASFFTARVSVGDGELYYMEFKRSSPDGCMDLLYIHSNPR